MTKAGNVFNFIDGLLPDINDVTITVPSELQFLYAGIGMPSLRILEVAQACQVDVHNNIPVLGVVCAPISPDRGRDCIAWAEGLPHLLRNGHPLQVDLSLGELSKDSIVWLSAAAANKPEINTELCFPSRFIAMPSIAYRLARAAIRATCGGHPGI